MNKDFGYGMGYELETYGIILKKASALIPNSSLYTKESHEYLDYSKYNITNEIDLTDELLCGGEVISPIIYNEIELENSIKLVLDVLEKTKAYDRVKRNSSASLHFHFGLEVLEKNKEYFIRLIKFLKAFEGEIYEYSHAEGDELRRTIGIFARPYHRKVVEEIIKYFENSEPNYKGINEYLSLKKYMFRLGRKTIEFRTCNNPLVDNEIISTDKLFDYEKSYEQFFAYFHMWQNILIYIKSSNYEKDLIESYYENMRENPYQVIKERERVFKRIIKKWIKKNFFNHKKNRW